MHAEEETMGTATKERPVRADEQDLAGKIAIVTGGTTGIGRATAYLLAERGVKVVITGRHEPELNDAVNDIRKAGDVTGIIADNAYEDQIERLFDEARRTYGDTDILINNAALPARSITEMSYDEALNVLRVNILGYLACTNRAVEMMKRKGGGHIVNIGSLSAKVREEGADVYVASKGATEAMSESLRKKLEKENPEIRLSLIEPGSVGTNLSGEQEDVEEQGPAIDEGRMLKAEDIAASVIYILTQPPRCNVMELRITPVNQGL
jgi:NADP-dependent 3-hydroxy acid dehydrogenase YdfG